jgi:hypothetical protein
MLSGSGTVTEIDFRLFDPKDGPLNLYGLELRTFIGTG